MTHKLIHTPDYLLVVDDSEIKEGDFVLVSCSELEVIETLKVKGYYNEQFLFDDGSQIHMDYCKKVIAHLPLNDSPILEGVNLLPPFPRHQEDGIRSLAREQFPNDGTVESGYLAGGFIEGYNKAKEKYRFTEEDMRKAFIEGTNHGSAYQSCIENEDWEAVKEMYENDDDIIKEIIQYLSQPKIPVGFECEENTFFATNAFSSDITLTSEGLQDTVLKGIKTTTNSQGQTVWVGKYIY